MHQFPRGLSGCTKEALFCKTFDSVEVNGNRECYRRDSLVGAFVTLKLNPIIAQLFSQQNSHFCPAVGEVPYYNRSGRGFFAQTRYIGFLRLTTLSRTYGGARQKMNVDDLVESWSWGDPPFEGSLSGNDSDPQLSPHRQTLLEISQLREL